jgi:homoserine kinase
MKKRIRVFAPATVANVGCGFDILGFAVDFPGDEVILKLQNKPEVTISKISGDDGKLPTNPEKNTVSISILSLLKYLKSDHGFEIELHKKMPLSSGLGSSAASAVAGVFAANELLGRPLQKEELLPFILEGEKIACGTGHADNAAPALLGGLVLIRSYSPLDIIKISSPDNLYCTLIHPHILIRTEDARKMLKQQISLKDATTQMGNIAGLISGMINEDFELIRRSMEDVIVEPVRSILIPGFREIKNAAMIAGALGCSISGSGPSIFALSTSESTAKKVGKSMQTVLQKLKINSDIYISKINHDGPRILED